MTEINENELKAFENLLIISGYVLDFNYKDFSNYIFDITNIDVDNEEYLKKVKLNYPSSSAGNIFKYFIHNEPKYEVIKLLKNFVNYVEEYKDKIENKKICSINQDDLNKCKNILKLHENKRYFKNDISIEKKLDNLINDINESIKNGNPELTLDRLHTYLNYYFKDLCDKHEIKYDEKEDKLNQIFKKYEKNISKKIESELSKTILKQTVSIFDKYNYVRNNKSYAHDNNILNSAESLLIYNNIVNIYEFIKTIEKNVMLVDK